MQSIWKFSLNVCGSQSISMPKGAKILTVQQQFDSPVLWAIVDPDQGDFEQREIRIYGTGSHYESIPGEYICTFQQNGFVWHVFEIKEQNATTD